MDFDVVIEIPRGSRNKYTVDHATGAVMLERTMWTASRYPIDYGFIPGTLGQDGDPMDALVILDEPAFPGCHVRCRAVAMLHMEDQAGGDDKILAVPTWDRARPWDGVRDIPRTTREEIEHFFEVYKDLDPGSFSRVRGWRGRTAAERALEQAFKRHGR
ncbi:MAG: inorganic diphosphatase [Candidatus Dormibacteraeota bacterium]|nr:inorganic diphosphatase [Candidatus Dormibacteraeota bacterium]MBV9526725.1 inorganic diphosphatase [Candidatus Dormibacteraeota bacterium]